VCFVCSDHHFNRGQKLRVSLEAAVIFERLMQFYFNHYLTHIVDILVAW